MVEITLKFIQFIIISYNKRLNQQNEMNMLPTHLSWMFFSANCLSQTHKNKKEKLKFRIEILLR